MRTKIFFRVMKQVVLLVVLFLSASATCFAQSADDGDMLYVYTKNSDEAALYQLDDLNKITFSDKGVRIWNTEWPTEYPYSKVNVITFRDKSNISPTGIEGISEENGQISIGYNKHSRVIVVRSAALLDGVAVYDLQGQLIFADNNKRQAYRISLENAHLGVYVVKAKDKYTDVVKKIVKQ